MSIKLGPHHMQGGADTRRWLHEAKPTVAKFVGDLGLSSEALTETLTVGRIVDDGKLWGQGFDVNRLFLMTTPEQAAEEYVRILDESIRLNPRIQVWEGPNEQVVTQAGPMEWYGHFCYHFAALLKTRGRRAGIGAWAVGLPDFFMWRHFTKGLKAVAEQGAYLTRHEYGPLDGYLSLRYRRDQAEFTRLGFPLLPVIVTEAGGGNVPDSGPWRTYYGTSERYWQELLLPYAQEMEKDAYCLGATVFTSGNGSTAHWNAYDITGSGLVDHLITYARSHTPPPVPTPVPAPAPSLVGQMVKLHGHAVLRQGPGITYLRLTALYKDSILRVQEEKNGWVRVTDNGWIIKTVVRPL